MSKTFNAWLQSLSLDADDREDHRQLSEELSCEPTALPPPNYDRLVQAALRGLSDKELAIIKKRFAEEPRWGAAADGGLLSEQQPPCVSSGESRWHAAQRRPITPDGTARRRAL